MSNGTKKLGDFLFSVDSVSPSVAYGGGDFTYLDIASVSRETRSIEAPQIMPTSGAPSRARQLVQSGDIIVSTVRPNLNTVAEVGAKYEGAIASTGFCVLRSNPEKLDHRYLYHWISSQKTVEYLVSVATGASYPAVSDRIIKGMAFEPPALAEQKRIAAILDKADSLRSKRQQAIQLADDFLRATFLDMFGDPVTNPKGWPLCGLENLGEIDRGVSKHRPRNDPSLLGGEYPLIQTGDVANSGGYITECGSFYSEKGLRQSRIWPKGTLCITIAANIAKSGILQMDACFPDSVVGFISDRPAVVEYVRFWFLFLQKILEDSAPESAQKNINLKILRSLRLPNPDPDVVDEFYSVVCRVNKINNFKKVMRLEFSKLKDALATKF